MPQRKIQRVSHEEKIQCEIARAREIIATSLEVLRQSHPDTFLGRQHHELTSQCYDRDPGNDSFND